MQNCYLILYMSMHCFFIVLTHINIMCSYILEDYFSVSKCRKLLVQGLVVNIISVFNLVILIMFNILIILCGESK